MTNELDLVSKLDESEVLLLRHSLKCISPDDAKYGETTKQLKDYLSADAEWRACAGIQRVLLETRKEFGQAEQKHVDEVIGALEKIDPLNMALLEEKVTKHDQLAVIEEIGRFVSLETKALLHPGTTSYDILDTARSYLFKKAWKEEIRPVMTKTVNKLCDIAERSIDVLQVGRTHLQDTSPVLFGGVMAGYAARLAERIERLDDAFKGLKGKISGIVGTGASIDMVIGEGKSIEFEKAVLAKLGLEPDYTATQIVQKERLSDIGHYLTSMMHVLRDFSDDICFMYSSAIGEVTSRDNAERLGGSSADATKNNPINYENIAGTPAMVEGGMRTLYEMISSRFQRDLKNSKQARYQPQLMMVETYESFVRLNRALSQLSINEDKLEENLKSVRKNPSEAMVAILRGRRWIHPKYGVGHNFVKEIGKKAKITNRPLIEIAMDDSEFREVHQTLSQIQQDILNGEIEKYTGSARERAEININYARSIAS